MKRLSTLAGLLLLFAFPGNIQAQKVKVTEGSIDAIKGETSINLEFTYDNMKVGKFDKEEDYVSKKKEEYNKKEEGRGDKWAKEWVADRQERFEPKFIELFTKYSNRTINKDAKYTIIFKTTFTEPGFYFGSSLIRKYAQIDGEAWIVETANKSNVIAKIAVNDAPGRTFGGYDFDTGIRITEAYAAAGKALGKYLEK